MFPTSRRSLLRATVAVAMGATAGCFGSGRPGTPAAPGSSREETTDRDASNTTTPAPPTAEPIRCRGEPVSVERTVEDPPGYEHPDTIEYFPDNRTIRFVTTRNESGPIGFDTWTFEQWGGIHSARVAVERVREVLPDRAGTDRFESGITTPIDQETGYEHVIVLGLVTRRKDGEVVRTPDVSLDRLLDAAPRGVDVTLVLQGDEYARTVPVYAEHDVRTRDW